MLDFKEIPKANCSDYRSDEFEFFAEEFFQLLNFTIEGSPGRGADGGRDLIVSEIIPSHIVDSKRRWLVSCKHSAHSNRAISKKDELELLDRVKRHNCDGFIGFYSVCPTQDLVHSFEELSYEVPCAFFNYTRIEKKLAESNGGLEIAKRYFPKSSIKLGCNINSNVPSSKPILECSNCGHEIIGNPIMVSAWGYDVDNRNSHTRTFNYFCSEQCEDQLYAMAEDCFLNEDIDYGYWSVHFDELLTHEGFIEFNANFGVNGNHVSTMSDGVKESISSLMQYLLYVHLFGK